MLEEENTEDTRDFQAFKAAVDKTLDKSGRAFRILGALSTLLLFIGLFTLLQSQNDLKQEVRMLADSNQVLKQRLSFFNEHGSSDTGFVRRPEPQVVALQLIDGIGEHHTATPVAVKLKVLNFGELLRQRPDTNSRLILYANGIALPGFYAAFHGVDHVGTDRSRSIGDFVRDPVWLYFDIRKTGATASSWQNLYQFAGWGQNSIDVEMSAGWEGGFPIAVGAGPKSAKVEISLYPPERFWMLSGFSLLLVLLIMLVASKTRLIRGYDGGGLGAYSLGQTQLFFWMALFVGSFCYVFVTTGEVPEISLSTLILLLLSVITNALAMWIDRKKGKSKDRRPKPHRGFWLDILSDGKGISLQRAQLVVWDVILGILMIYYLTTYKIMAELSDNLLLISGFSSGLYIMAKTLELNEADDLPRPEEGLAS